LWGPRITEHTKACWARIKETLDGLGVRFENIVFVRYYLVNRDDWWDMWRTTHDFFQQHAPDLTEHARAATLLKGIQLDLPGQLIEIEVTAVIPKK
jgi:enamine deaminase RidA (YjgF/YER057c/UK114 family)